MAQILIVSTMSGLRRDAVSQFQPGEDFYEFAGTLRGLAEGALASSEATELAAHRGELEISLRFNDLDVVNTTGDDDDECEFVGTIKLSVDNEAAYNYRDPNSAVAGYLAAAISAFNDAFAGLPNGGADLLTAMGVSNPATQVKVDTAVVFSAGLL